MEDWTPATFQVSDMELVLDFPPNCALAEVTEFNFLSL